MKALWLVLIALLLGSCAVRRRTETKQTQTTEQCTMSNVSLLTTTSDLVHLSNIRCHLNAVIFDNTDSVPRVAALVSLTQQATDSARQSTVTTSADSATESHSLTAHTQDTSDTKAQTRGNFALLSIGIIGGILAAILVKKKYVFIRKFLN
jgi:hypothetical protein